MYYKNINCDTYDSNTCPREITVEKTETELLSTDQYHMLFVGCWGVYCKEGNNKVSKYKKKNKDNPWSEKEVVYGQKQVVNAMTNYSNAIKGGVNNVILAGDNVYSDYIQDQDRDKPGIVDKIYNIDKQLSEGFENCMAEVNTQTFMVGIGNHDVENCYILNRQLAYKNKGWNMYGMSYNIVEICNGYRINFIFIDTNMYTDKWCDGNPYPPEAIPKQCDWLRNVVSKDPNVWNIVIGHVPFMYNNHKDPNINQLIQTPGLYECIQANARYIDLYMCADEHNQQFITKPNIPPIVIAGSGGTALDDVYIAENDNSFTQLAVSSFGFVSTVISKKSINLTFHLLGYQSVKSFVINSRTS